MLPHAIAPYPERQSAFTISVGYCNPLWYLDCQDVGGSLFGLDPVVLYDFAPSDCKLRNPDKVF